MSLVELSDFAEMTPIKGDHVIVGYWLSSLYASRRMTEGLYRSIQCVKFDSRLPPGYPSNLSN